MMVNVSNRFLLSLQLWIKMFIYEKGILKMKSDEWNPGVQRLHVLVKMRDGWNDTC